MRSAPSENEISPSAPVAEANALQQTLSFIGVTGPVDLVGSSYTLNDHALDANPYGDDYPTLVPRHAEALRSMRGIWIDAGTRDEWYLDLTAEWLRRELTALAEKATRAGSASAVRALVAA